MYPDSYYASPVSSFQRPVDVPGIDPNLGDQVGVIFSRTWLPYVIGALYQLLLQSTWNASGDELDTVQGQAFDLIYLFASAVAPLSNSAQIEDTQSMPEFRTVCDDNATYLEWKICTCPETWQRLAPISDVPAPNQANSNPANPGAGQSIQYCNNLPANQQLRLAAIVNGGDIITLNSASGGWHDGSANPWNCPDGRIYFAGACVNGTTTQSGDPVNTAPHMSVIALINSQPYALTVGTPFTVPSGFSGATVTLQCNDSALSDNSGSADVCVTVTNNVAVTWQHHLDFRYSDYGFVVASGSASVWTPGVGWVGGNGSSAPSYVAVDIDCLGLNTSILDGVQELKYTIANDSSPADVGGTAPAGGSFTYIWHDGNAYGYSGSVDLIGSVSLLTFNLIGLDIAAVLSGGGAVTLTDMYLNGQGADPFATYP